MAMKIESKYLPRQLRSEHWKQLWKEAGFTEAQARNRTIQFTKKALSTVKKTDLTNPTQKSIADFIQAELNKHNGEC